MKVMFEGHNYSVAESPTKDFTHWHFICGECNKPVKTEQAWFDGKNQVHFECFEKDPK